MIEREIVEALIPAGRAVSFEREVFPELVGDGLFGFAAAGYWVDIGTPERYLPGHLRPARWAGRVRAAAARRDRLPDRRGLPHQRRPHRPAVGARRPLLGGQRLHVERSILHDRVIVGDDCLIREAILARGVRVGDGARVEPGAIVGSDAEVGAGAVVEADARIEPGATVAAGERVA